MKLDESLTVRIDDLVSDMRKYISSGIDRLTIFSMVKDDMSYIKTLCGEGYKPYIWYYKKGIRGED